MHKITESLYFQPLIHDQKTHFIRVIEFINNLLLKKSATVIFLSIQYQLTTITTVKGFKKRKLFKPTFYTCIIITPLFYE